jgi:ankyrin repeat protein
VRLLLDKGAIVNTKADYGYSALHAAAGRSDKDLKVVELLVARGAQIDAEWNGATPLHRAAWSGNAQAAEFLISKGANVNAKDQRGRTPLAWAIEKGYDDVAELLRKHGAVE